MKLELFLNPESSQSIVKSKAYFWNYYYYF